MIRRVPTTHLSRLQALKRLREENRRGLRNLTLTLSCLFLLIIAVYAIPGLSSSHTLFFGPANRQPGASREGTGAAKPPRINISTQQYETALAKWCSQDIEEYEITTNLFGFYSTDTTLRVSDYGKKIEIIDPSNRISTPEPELLESYRVHTVEGLFADVQAFLNEEVVIHSGAYSS